MQSHHVAITEADNMLQHLASIFRHNQRALKFLIMERLPAMLLVCFEPQHQMGDKSTRTAQEHRAWIEDIRIGLFYILVSKIGRLHKEQALTLCAYMLRYFGESWTLGTIPPLGTGGTDFLSMRSCGDLNCSLFCMLQAQLAERQVIRGSLKS